MPVECRAKYVTQRVPHAPRRRGAVIRVGGGGPAAGSLKPGYWLTVAEAEELRAELDRAIRLARGCAISGIAISGPPTGPPTEPPTEPPPASSGALPVPRAA